MKWLMIFVLLLGCAGAQVQPGVLTTVTSVNLIYVQSDYGGQSWSASVIHVQGKKIDNRGNTFWEFEKDVKVMDLPVEQVVAFRELMEYFKRGQ